MDRFLRAFSRFWLRALRPAAQCIAARSGFAVSGVPADLKGPYLILSNHIGDRDMFFLTAMFRQPLCFVASEDLFCRGFLSRLLELFFYPIPLFKAGTGTRAARAILKRLRAGDCVALFPEGRHSPDGRTGPFKQTTAALARAAGCPVLTVRLSGYFAKPRWAASPRKGPVTAELRHIYSPQELAALSEEALYDAIRSDLSADAYAAQRRAAQPYPGKRLAEHLEQCYFLCPCCGQAGGIRSEQDRFFCVRCGMEGRMDAFGMLTGERLAFDALPAWWDWQQSSFLQRRSAAGEEEVLLRDEGVVCRELLLQGSAAHELATDTLCATKRELRFGSRRWAFERLPLLSARGGPHLQLEDGSHHYEFALSGRSAEGYLMLSRAARAEAGLEQPFTDAGRSAVQGG